MKPLRNPSLTRLLGLLNRSAHDEVRGLISGDDLWWWDSNEALHDEMARLIGHEAYLFDRLYLEHTQDRQKILLGRDPIWTYSRIMAHPRLSVLARSSVIHWLMDNQGWIPGPGWIVLNQPEQKFCDRPPTDPD